MPNMSKCKQNQIKNKEKINDLFLTSHNQLLIIRYFLKKKVFELFYAPIKSFYLAPYDLNIQSLCIFKKFRMTYEIREFEIAEEDDNYIWKFKLGNSNLSRIDFFSEQQSVRSLFHLSQDFLNQIEATIGRKKKKIQPKDRVIRKLCQKMLKTLGVSLKIFSNDINESLESVKAYFQKQQIHQELKTRIQQKCQKWVLEAWVRLFSRFRQFLYKLLLQKEVSESFILSLPPSSFFKSCQKYLESLYKDGKRISPDFQLLNQFYLIVQGDDFIPQNIEKNVDTQNMVLIDLNFNAKGQYISESFLWNPQITSKVKIVSFLKHFLSDIFFDKGIEIQQSQYDEIIEDSYIQLRTQALYKILLKKHAGILLNFSTLQISQDVRQYLIEIEIKLSDQNGHVFFTDNFQWDIISQTNNIEDFCRTLMEDEDIPKQYFSELCYKIKTQINAQLHWKFTMLVKTFRSIHKERQSPKLNTQTMTQLKKNIIYSMDVNIPFNPDKEKPQSSIYLNNSDIFSTLSRNADILPEEFHQILLCKQSTKNIDREKEALISDIELKTKADNYLKSHNYKIEQNNYLGKFTSLYKAHNIWRQQILKNKPQN